MSLTDHIREWYMDAFPTDELGKDINPAATFDGLYSTLNAQDDPYNYIGVGDSVIRERCFGQLADELGVSYDKIYDLWLDGPKSPAEPALHTYKIPVVWQMMGYQTIEATSLEEALDAALFEPPPLPNNAMILEDSFEIDREGITDYLPDGVELVSVEEFDAFRERYGALRTVNGAQDSVPLDEQPGSAPDKRLVCDTGIDSMRFDALAVTNGQISVQGFNSLDEAIAFASHTSHGEQPQDVGTKSLAERQKATEKQVSQDAVGGKDMPAKDVVSADGQVL